MELETRDIQRLLSVPDIDPSAMSRRRFLQAAALGAGALAAYTKLSGGRDAAWSAPLGAHDGVLVLVNLQGGNDALNMLVPYGIGAYYDKRGAVSIAAKDVLAIDGQVGLHPSLGWLHEQYQAGHVALVEGIGLADPDLSHFTSTAVWMEGRTTPSDVPTSGWLGRFVDHLPGAGDLFHAVTIGPRIPLLLVGDRSRATGLPEYVGSFGVSADSNDQRMYRGLRAMAAQPNALGGWADALAGVTRDMLDVDETAAPLYVKALPTNSLTRQMVLGARLINANLGIRVVHVSLDSFDTHADQLGHHSGLLAEIDEALRLFYAELDPRFDDRVTVATFSEFGRPPTSNDSNGTDHGTAGTSLVIGKHVRGGRHGAMPSLTNLTQWGQMTATLDQRSLFATLVERWLGGDATSVIGSAFSQLDLFTAAPGTTVAGPGISTPGGGGGPAPAVQSSFVAVNPARVLDTREGIGGRSTPIGPGETIELAMLAHGGVPAANVTAVALNVTVTEPTASGYLTVWPSGEAQPLASNLNFTRGQTVPNMVVAALGQGGRISLFNSVGATQVVADVVGYFAPVRASGLVPMSPIRVLDTRDGTGGIGGVFNAAEARTLALSGIGGLPTAGVAAVVLNVTVTEPSSAGYLTLWPAGEERPVASNLNFVRGATVPNLVMCKVADGAVSLFNSAGTTHVVADLVGYFTPSGDGVGLTPLVPTRLVDTREAKGIAGALGPRSAARLRVAGTDLVPSSARAVVLNVTVTEPTAAGYLTVWPADHEQPVASNLNFIRGQTVPNLVICATSADGEIAFYNSAGTTHLVADLVAYC